MAANSVQYIIGGITLMFKRKNFIFTSAMVIVLAMFTSSCGSKESTETQTDGASTTSADVQATVTIPAATASAAPTSETRSYETVKGTITIPLKPQRIVTDYYGGELLSVGGNVVGIEPTAFTNPFLAEMLKNTEDLGMPLNLEKIVELKPDLIVVMGDKNYEQMSQIAPTLHIPFGTATNLNDTLRLFEGIVGEKGKADQFIAEFDIKAADAREKLKGIVDPKATFGLYELVDNGDLWIFGDYAGRGGHTVYNALGYLMPTKHSKSKQTVQLSMETLPSYAGDYIFLTVYDPEKKGEALKQLQSSAVWSNLPALKNNRLFINDYDSWYPNDPLAISGQLDLIVEMLITRAAEKSK